MTLKKSFLPDMRENSKRRVWVFLLSALVWFFYYPVGMALMLSRARSTYLMQAEHGALSALSESAALKEAAVQWLFFEEILMVLAILFAVICAVQGFSFLYSRKKVDLYYSVPVKKTRRFAVIWLNGVLIYLAPMLPGLLLSMGVAAVNGAMSAEAFQVALLIFVMNLMLFLATYSLIIVAVMLTGNLIITLLASAVFLLYEVVVKQLVLLYKDEFFRFYSYRSVEGSTVLSPAGYYIASIREVSALSAGAALSDAWTICLPAILLNLLMAVLFGLIGFYCYKKRPSEAAGRTMAFPGTKAAVKLLLVIPAALAAGLMVWEVTGGTETPGNVMLLLFVLAAAVILGCGIMEVIYERDIRAALSKKRQILIAGAGVALLYCVFRFDLAGVDRWEPDPENLQDAVVLMSPIVYQDQFYNEDLTWVEDRTAYFLSRPGVTDVAAICELTQARVSDTEEEQAYVGLDVAYRMKNGKVKWRFFPVSFEKEELLNRVMDDEAYRKTFYPWYNDDFFERFLQLSRKTLTFDSGIAVLNLSPDDMEEVRRQYLEDFGASLFSTLVNENVCGRIAFSAKNQRNESVEFILDVYPSYTNTITWLKEKGVWEAGELKPENVESITVTNYHNELQKPVYYSASERMSRHSGAYSPEEYEVTKTFTDPGQIRELIKAMYPERFPQNFKRNISRDYYVTVRLKNGAADAGKSSAYYRGSNSFCLFADRIPEFVVAQTAWK